MANEFAFNDDEVDNGTNEVELATREVRLLRQQLDKLVAVSRYKQVRRTVLVEIKKNENHFR